MTLCELCSAGQDRQITFQLLAQLQCELRQLRRQIDEADTLIAKAARIVAINERTPSETRDKQN